MTGPLTRAASVKDDPAATKSAISLAGSGSSRIWSAAIAIASGLLTARGSIVVVAPSRAAIAPAEFRLSRSNSPVTMSSCAR